MDVVDHLRARLVEEKGFQPIETLVLSEASILPQEGLDFVGTRKYWGSMVSIAVSRAGGLSEQEIGDLCEGFYSFTRSLRRYAGRMPPLIGTKLGSFGILCFVFETGCGEGLMDFIQRQKRGSASSYDYAVFWVLDVENARVHTHRGAPLRGMFPGKAYLESLLHEYEEITSSHRP